MNTEAYTFIKNHVAQLVPEPTFGYGERDWQNLIADKDNFPVVYLDEPPILGIVSEDTILDGGAIDSTYRLSMVFLQQTQLDFTPEQHDMVIADMRALARQFIIRLYDSTDALGRRSLKKITGIRRTNIKNVFDLNASGCVLELSITPLGGDSLCIDVSP
jgi:hypothetical protein